ncbi:MAG: hypothetical protein HQK95_04295 [Nitrospirae bacterium]|nr:hypothetical protein [Nitrospirota bacterium]
MTEERRDNIDLFKYYGEQKKVEHELLTHRMTWYMVSQSFLIISFVNCLGRTVPPVNYFLYIIPILGFSTTLLIWPAIYGAITTINMWHDKKYKFIKQLILDCKTGCKMGCRRWCRTGRCPEIGAFTIDRHYLSISPTAVERRDDIHLNSLLFAKYHPLIFLILWLGVLIMDGYGLFDKGWL